MTSADKPRKLLFHVGHHKTGTTSIQNAFVRKEVRLPGGQILYPGNLAHNYLARHARAYLRDGTPMQGRPGMPGLDTISDRMAKGNFDYTVISGEAFEDFDPAQLKTVIDKFFLPHVSDHAVIAYVRPHAARFLSSFAEQDKGGWMNGAPEAFFDRSLAQGRFNYAQKMPKWQAAFGDHFRLRPLIRSELVGGSVLQDFIDTGFGPDAGVEVSGGGVANESLCLEDLIVLQTLHKALAEFPLSLREALGWVMAEHFAAERRLAGKGAGTKLRLHKALAERIRAAYRDDAQSFDAAFFGGRALFAAELDKSVDDALPSPQSFDPADHFSTDALVGLRVLCTQMARMFMHNPESWADFLRDQRVAAGHGVLAETPPGAAQVKGRNLSPRKPKRMAL